MYIDVQVSWLVQSATKTRAMYPDYLARVKRMSAYEHSYTEIEQTGSWSHTCTTNDWDKNCTLFWYRRVRHRADHVISVLMNCACMLCVEHLILRASIAAEYFHTSSIPVRVMLSCDLLPCTVWCRAIYNSWNILNQRRHIYTRKSGSNKSLPGLRVCAVILHCAWVINHCYNKAESI